MPIHLPSSSRREFIQRSVLGGVALLTCRAFGDSARAVDPHHWVLFSDTHIAGDVAVETRGANMANHMQAAVAAVRSGTLRPAGLIVNGDCALQKGLPEDYATFGRMLQPLSETGIPIHLTLGNHDNRDTFWQGMRDQQPATLPAASKHVSVVESERANWFLLDSLDASQPVAGRLGEEQVRWLATALDAHPGKPALVMLHHNPEAAGAQKKTGLLDTEELLSMLLARRHVKALFFGHTHTWSLQQREGMHLVNLPAVAYAFSNKTFTGWTDCHLRNDGMSLETHAHDAARPENRKLTELSWRV